MSGCAWRVSPLLPTTTSPTSTYTKESSWTFTATTPVYRLLRLLYSCSCNNPKEPKEQVTALTQFFPTCVGLQCGVYDTLLFLISLSWRLLSSGSERGVVGYHTHSITVRESTKREKNPSCGAFLQSTRRWKSFCPLPTLQSTIPKEEETQKNGTDDNECPFF